MSEKTFLLYQPKIDWTWSKNIHSFFSRLRHVDSIPNETVGTITIICTAVYIVLLKWFDILKLNWEDVNIAIVIVVHAKCLFSIILMLLYGIDALFSSLSSVIMHRKRKSRWIWYWHEVDNFSNIGKRGQVDLANITAM